MKTFEKEGLSAIAPRPPVRDAQAQTELADTILLHRVSAELISEEDGGVIYHKLLEVAVALMRSDFGSLHVLEAGAHGPQLRLLAAHGFVARSERRWSLVDADSGCACALAMRDGVRVISADLAHDRRIAAKDLLAYRRAGMLAMQSTPLVTRSGHLLGMLSTQWRRRYEPTPVQLRLFDILARQAADLLERNQADTKLREREAWLAGQKESMQAAMDGASLGESLGVLVRVVTAQLDDGMRAAFFLADDEGKQLRHLVGMGEEYATLVNGLHTGPESLACALVATSCEPVITDDVQAEPRWQPWLWLAERFGYRACWSFPIHTAAGTFVGTLALYWPHPCSATPRHLELVARITQTAAIIISREIEARERRRTAAALTASEAALREADHRKDKFLAMLAHELRNPVAAIRNATCLLLNHPDQAAITRSSQLIDRQTTLLAELVDDLLDVSRITRGLIVLRHEPCELQAVVDHALATLQPAIEEKHHELTCVSSAGTAQVVGDAGRIEQIVVNLVGNAVKYTDPAGRIRVAMRVDGDEVELSVSDNGIGMSPEVCERVFDLFSQAERGLARSHGGLGVGLTIVKQLVELHGGTVTAFSEGLGHGSAFTVRLPRLQRQTTPKAAPPPAPEPGQLRDCRVLVVDDRVDCADSMGFLMQLQGAQARVVHEGLRALDVVVGWHPQVVLLDLGLPDIDGYEVARRIRSLPDGGDMRLVALSGYGQPADVELARQAGFDRHFIKPVDIAALVRYLTQPPTDPPPSSGHERG